MGVGKNPEKKLTKFLHIVQVGSQKHIQIGFFFFLVSPELGKILTFVLGI
jgi:hypothetical protein